MLLCAKINEAEETLLQETFRITACIYYSTEECWISRLDGEPKFKLRSGGCEEVRCASTVGTRESPAELRTSRIKLKLIPHP